MFDAFATIDSLIPLSDFFRIVVWAALSGGGSMILYRWISPQKKLESIQRELSCAQKEMAAYDGAFAGLRPLIARNLNLAFKRVALSVVPSVVAGLPLILTIICIDHLQPQSEQSVNRDVVAIETESDLAKSNEPTTELTVVRFSDGENLIIAPPETSRYQQENYLGFGPDWMRSWICLFMLTSSIAALSAKFVLRIA